MDNISKQLERLKSPKKDTRYDACEELRVASHVPEEALDALRQATHDPALEVAEAAQRALAAHPNAAPASDQPSDAKSWGGWHMGVISPLVSLLVIGGVYLSAYGCLTDSSSESSGWCVGTFGDGLGLMVGTAVYLCVVIPISIILGVLAARVLSRIRFERNRTAATVLVEIVIGLSVPVVPWLLLRGM